MEVLYTMSGAHWVMGSWRCISFEDDIVVEVLYAFVRKCFFFFAISDIPVLGKKVKIGVLK